MEGTHTREHDKFRKRTLRYGVPFAVGLSLASVTFLTQPRSSELADRAPHITSALAAFSSSPALLHAASCRQHNPQTQPGCR